MGKLRTKLSRERRSEKVTRVVLIGVAGDHRTEQAQQQLASVEGLGHEYSPCPASLGEVVRLPLLRDENGRGYFGLRAIENFLAKQRGV